VVISILRIYPMGGVALGAAWVAEEICTGEIFMEKKCTQEICTEEACTEEICTEMTCTGEAGSEEICTEEICLEETCAGEAGSGEICTGEMAMAETAMDEMAMGDRASVNLLVAASADEDEGSRIPEWECCSELWSIQEAEVEAKASPRSQIRMTGARNAICRTIISIRSSKIKLR
jgi:hypothetical protein